jgi:hypothetical protein
MPFIYPAKKMKRLPLLFAFLIPLFAILLSCTHKSSPTNPYNARIEFRFGTKFYSMYLCKWGTAYVVKGKGTNYTSPFAIISSDTSKVFKIDSLNVAYNFFDKLKTKPIIDTSGTTDAPRIEIYYEDKKVYDSFKWNSEIWDLFRPMLTKLPQGYNPFLGGEHPFD